VSNGTRWVGVDLHRRRSQIAIIDEHGELVLSRRIVNEPEMFTELLGDPDGVRVALEASYGWEWLADLLQEGGYEVHLAHPLRVRAIAAARVKTDAVDAPALAHLLRTGLLPEAYIAPPELRDLRDLLRHRVTLVHLRTAPDGWKRAGNPRSPTPARRPARAPTPTTGHAHHRWPAPCASEPGGPSAPRPPRRHASACARPPRSRSCPPSLQLQLNR
jgi:hypothetical protein